jgi:hypothetical protein
MAISPILPCNLSELDEVDKLVPSAEAAMGGLDILVNNAGVTRDNLFMRMKDEEWDEVIAVNLTSAFHLTRAVLRGMMKQRFGRIIGITSVVGVVGNPGQGNYAASKAGLIGMNKALALRGCLAQHHRQHRRARLYRFGHDRRTQRQAARVILVDGSGRPAGDRRRKWRLVRFPRQRRGGLHHGPHVERQRRHGDALTPVAVRERNKKRPSENQGFRNMAMARASVLLSPADFGP